MHTFSEEIAIELRAGVGAMSTKFVHLVDPERRPQVGEQPLHSRLAERLFAPVHRFLPARKAKRITGIHSPYGDAEGWLIAAGPAPVRRREAEAVVRFARRVGARVVGLGFPDPALDEDATSLARDLSIRVSSGTTLATCLTVDVIEEAARLMGADLRAAEAVILGVSGQTGRVLGSLMAGVASNLTLVGADEGALERLAKEVLRSVGVSAQVSTDLHRSLRGADLVVVLPGTGWVDPAWIKPGAIVLDVARCMSGGAFEARGDVLFLRGGLVQVPGDVDFGLGLAYPQGMCDASLAETILLALEDRHEDCAIDIWSTERIEAMGRLASRHGFRYAGLQGPAGIITAAEIIKIRGKAEADATCGPGTTGPQTDHRILDRENACR